MRRLLTLLSVFGFAVFALPSAAVAQGADVYGVGGGSINLGGSVKFMKFAFSAHTGPQGDFGSFRFTYEDPNAPLDVRGDVDCVHVFPLPLGAGGFLQGPVKKVTPQPNVYGVMPGDQVVMGFNDFGEPSDPVSDQLEALFVPFPQVCKFFTPGTFTPIDQGNINIKLG